MADPATDDPSKGSGNTLTQEQVDAIVEERLARERKKYSDYDDLKKQVEELKAAAAAKAEEADDAKSETEKLTEQLQKLQSGLEEEKSAREKAELKSLRAEVASAKEVPAAFVDRLTGTTREELEEDADSILEAIGGGEEPEDRKPGVVRQPKSALKGGSNSSTGDTADEVKKVFDSIDPT